MCLPGVDNRIHIFILEIGMLGRRLAAAGGDAWVASPGFPGVAGAREFDPEAPLDPEVATQAGGALDEREVGDQARRAARSVPSRTARPRMRSRVLDKLLFWFGSC